MTAHPPVQIVDEEDRVIGDKEIGQAYTDNEIVRISRIYLYNDQGQILLQQRADHIKRWPGAWDNSAAGHVDKGETYEQAAYREMHEELGVSDDVTLNKIDYHFKQEPLDDGTTSRRFNTTYTALYNGEFNPDPDEVQDVKWVSFEEIERLIKEEPETLSPGLLSSFNECKDKLKNKSGARERT